jgi:hypothetical protein
MVQDILSTSEYQPMMCRGLMLLLVVLRAGDGIRTREYQLGRLMPYHLATPACLREGNST